MNIKEIQKKRIETRTEKAFQQFENDEHFNNFTLDYNTDNQASNTSLDSIDTCDTSKNKS